MNIAVIKLFFATFLYICEFLNLNIPASKLTDLSLRKEYLKFRLHKPENFITRDLNSEHTQSYALRGVLPPIKDHF